MTHPESMPIAEVASYKPVGPPWKMARNVIRKHGIKGLVVERDILRNVALLEMRPLSETSCQRKLVCIANSGLPVDGGPHDECWRKLLIREIT
jgi:hypothetical protein